MWSMRCVANWKSVNVSSRNWPLGPIGCTSMMRCKASQLSEVASLKSSLRVAVELELGTSIQDCGSSLVFSSAMIRSSTLCGDCLMAWDSTLMLSRMYLRLGARSDNQLKVLLLQLCRYTRVSLHAVLIALAF